MRIVVAEDSPILRDGLVQLLAMRGHQVPRAVPDASTLAEAVRTTAPDLVVVDVRMPPTHTDEGLRAALELRASHPALGIVMFSQYVETRYLHELLGSGAAGVGYLLKDRVADIDEFVAALQRVADGGTALDPEVVERLVSNSRRRAGPLNRLTARESQVLSLMAEGRSNAGIAARLGVSQRAVEKHVAAIFTKLDLPASDESHRRVLAVLEHLRA